MDWVISRSSRQLSSISDAKLPETYYVVFKIQSVKQKTVQVSVKVVQNLGTRF